MWVPETYYDGGYWNGGGTGLDTTTQYPSSTGGETKTGQILDFATSVLDRLLPSSRTVTTGVLGSALPSPGLNVGTLLVVGVGALVLMKAMKGRRRR